VILALTLILVVFVRDPFNGAVSLWRWWNWIVLGLLAEALIVGTTLVDPDVRARIANQLIRDRFDLAAFSDAGLREQVAGALNMREQMESVVQHMPDEGPGAQLRVLADEITTWIAAMYALAMQLDDCQSDAVLRRKRSSLQAAIRNLESEIGQATSARPRADLESILASKRSEWAQLEGLDRLVESATSQLRDQHDALARIYTQMQLSAARGSARRRAGLARRASREEQQLGDDVAEYVRSLSEMRQEIAESYQQVSERA
jgi:hypothetical protein